MTNYVNSTDDITSRFEVESISNRFFILDIIVEIIEWAGVGLLLIAFLIVLFESLVFLKVVYKQRKVSYIQKRNMKATEEEGKKHSDIVDDDDDDRIRRKKSRRRTMSVSPRNLKRLKHEFESHDKKKIFAINQIKEKQRRNTISKIKGLRDKLKHNAARQRLGMGLLHKHKHGKRKKILPKPPPRFGKKNNFKIPIHKRRDKHKKSRDLMVEEVVEEFHSNAELYQLEIELIRNKQIERTKQKLALRREKKRQMLATEKRKRERSQAWKKKIFLTRIIGDKEKFKKKAEEKSPSSDNKKTSKDKEVDTKTIRTVDDTKKGAFNFRPAAPPKPPPPKA